MSRPKEDSRAEHSASAHFIALDIALSRGDYAAADRAQKALADLGWDIRHRPARPHEPRLETAGAEGGER
jgi:hypothetical protein